MPQFSKR